ncbi:interferon-inducible GTPase-domain-containing protein [Suillus placidus]|uniref:Interferon-inducible GTPase-domain-containing protein n=1 Tax=Suillus placidus TaxID=48579 RepID=A0A9P6ZII5_9AGAM|nr:interferon-inducible GTPase-domain-containing protein [Suillus placidus]
MPPGAVAGRAAVVAGPVQGSLLTIAFLAYKLWGAKRDLSTMSKTLDTAKRDIEEEKGASRAAKRTAENARRRQEESERAAAEAAEALQRVEEARLATERRWFKGVRPECHPSEEDIVRMKAAYRYSPGFLHLAVIGFSGSGKSSFINAIRGLSNNDPVAAPTGIVETTDAVTRYTDPRQDSQIFWYDIPGAGTRNVPDWQYFNNLGLYIFDCIIVLIDNRFLDSDLAILRACEQFTNIEVFVARSKSDQHINNMALDMMPRGFDPCHADDEARSRFQQIKSETRRKFIDETRHDVQANLESNNISPKKVYIVCRDAMHSVWNNSPSPMAIDEEELQNDVAEFVRRRLHGDI